MISDRERRLGISIIATVGAYGAIEIGVNAIVVSGYGIGWSFFGAFLAAQSGFQLALMAFLWLMRNSFYTIPDGHALDRINIANMVTLARISLLPLLLFLVIESQAAPIGPIVLAGLAVTFLTDLIDGRLSRARNEVTHIGKILDSVSDYSLLFVIALVFVIFRLLPAWLFGVIVFRLAFQAFGMLGVLLIRRRVEPQPTVFGKIAVATTMVLLAAEALRFVVGRSWDDWFPFAEYLAGLVIALSVLDKAWRFLQRDIRQKPPRTTPPNA
jgi:phosphatidylglycerophosphate synthase